jgi:oligopeptide transport system permease protein
MLQTSADGLSATMQANVQQLYFLMGTDAIGRDLFSRILISLRISLMIGALATGVALVIGVLYGATAGFVGGRIDNVMMRIVDILYSLPFVFFVILLVVFFGRNVVLMFIAVGCVEWLDMARIVRGQTLSLRRREFVQAAQTLGVRSRDIVRRHIIPNTLGTVIIYMTLMIPKVILLESFLSFLGLGVQEPLTSLGVLIAEGAKNMRNAPFMLFWPALTMTVLLFALNFLGDGLRDALDPKDR